MRQLELDLRNGATCPALLGALVEAGASLEAVEHAVATLGSGDVRLQVQAGAGGTAIRVHAPEGAPTVDTWDRLRPRIALLALDEPQVTLALATLDALFQARADVHGVPVEDVDVDPFSGPDDLANALSLAAATVSLGHPVHVSVTAVGHGTGTMTTIEGPVELPGPVVAELLTGRATLALDSDRELVDPVAAAYVAAVASAGDADGTSSAGAGTGTGRGRLPDGSTLLATVSRRD